MRRIEEGSRTGRSSEHHTIRERSRSEAGSRYERPLTILSGHPRTRSPEPSHVSHRSHRSDEKRTSHHGSRKDSDSYVSARSKRTGDVKYITASPPPPHSRSSTTTIRVVPKDERRSVVSARQVPLPMSRVGGGSYAASVAPSDSVSSVGTKRERERLRERMRERY